MDTKAPAETLVRLEKQACRGFCPNYIMELSSDGTLKFEGKRHVAFIGTTQRVLSEEEMTSVQTLLAGSSFMSLNELYDNNIVDIPFEEMEVHYDGQSRLVRCRGDQPGAFAEIESLLERLAQVALWLEQPEETNDDPLNQLIIELHDPDQVILLEERYGQLGLRLNKRISPRQLYFLFDIDATEHRDEILDVLRQDPEVKTIQWNRKLKRRDQ